MAMAAAIAAAACPTDTDVTVITGWESVATSYPGFIADLNRLGSTGEGGR
jgi:5-enolpyruvylshikimate-3-phosphate synthase